MTTLAFDGKILAADSKASQGHIAMVDGTNKIFTPKENEYWSIQGVKILAFGLGGNPDDLPWILEELNKDVTHRTTAEDAYELNFLIIAVDETGLGWFWSMYRSPGKKDNWVLSPIGKNLAAGSGQTIAKAILSVGAGAVAAVEAAIKLDNHSGGTINTWEFPGAPETPSVRPEPVVEAAAVPPVLTPEEIEAQRKQAEDRQYDAAVRIVGSRLFNETVKKAVETTVTPPLPVVEAPGAVAEAKAILDKAEKVLVEAQSLVDKKPTKKAAVVKSEAKQAHAIW